MQILNSVFLLSFWRNPRLLKPNEVQQIDALLTAMSEILWSIGEKLKVIIPLPGDVVFISHSHSYFQDTVTERVKNCFFLNQMPYQLSLSP